jgi:gamma-glutamyltranspeptidase / glutathione hydrolase
MMPGMLEAQGFGGAVVTPHVLSTQAGMEALQRGGSAVDAAIAANAVQGVVAPETCGVGGDLFALIHAGDGVSALNASGRAGSNVSADRLRANGLTSIPRHHPAGVTVPGCVAGWFALHARHGRLPMQDLLQRAVDLGREGFPASTEYSLATHRMAAFLSDHQAGAELLVDGVPPGRGQRVHRFNLSRTLEGIGSDGPTAFYEGAVAASISAAVDGLITSDDLAGYSPEWVTPISTDVFGVTGWTIPPNSQGYLSLATLWIFEQLTPTVDPGDPRWTHLLIEAYRAMMTERNDVVADPDFAPLAPESLLDPERLATFAKQIRPDAVTTHPPTAPKPGGTMFMCAIDGDGVGVSLIESNFRGIGSGIGAGDSGFILHDRGGGFDLRPGHPNEIAAGKRPLHTLSPTLWTKGSRLRTLLGTRGGHQQPQLLAQVAALLFAAGRSPGHAQAEPRWTISDISEATSVVDVESTMSAHITHGLRSHGHTVQPQPGRVGGWGPVSMIDIDERGLRTAASDPRVDTAAAAVR